MEMGMVLEAQAHHGRLWTTIADFGMVHKTQTCVILIHKYFREKSVCANADTS